MRLTDAISMSIATMLGCSAVAVAEPLPVETIRALAEANSRPAIALYRDFLSLPNDANYPDDIARMVEWLEVEFPARGFTTQRIATSGSPLLFAARQVADDVKTVLIYLQSDRLVAGRPVHAGPERACGKWAIRAHSVAHPRPHVQPRLAGIRALSGRFEGPDDAIHGRDGTPR